MQNNMADKKQKEMKVKNKGKEQSDLENTCQEYLAGWKRALADYENLKQTTDQQLTEGRSRIRTSLAHDLLPVMDNFQQAMNHVPTQDTDQKTFNNWLQGVVFIAKQFEDVMQSMGIEPVKTIGEIFDPNLHEASGTLSDSEKNEQEILEEVTKGWKIGETVIRPARVIINEIK